jgi:hypothetical protein
VKESRRTATRAMPDTVCLSEPFHAHAIFEPGKPGGVAARACQARDQAGGL